MANPMPDKPKTLPDKTQEQWCAILTDCLLTGKPGDMPLHVRDMFAQARRQAEERPIKLSLREAEAMAFLP